MISAAPQTQENVGMLGHVECKVLDKMGNIKSYMQNDNVVEAGKDCASQGLFINSGQVGQCIAGSAAFTYIGIGNGSSGTINVANTTLADASTDNDNTANCSRSALGVGTAGGGEMSRRNVTASFDVSGTNTVVTLDTSSKPFTFNAGNATSVIDSGIFNADYSGTVTDGQCPPGTQTTALAELEICSQDNYSMAQQEFLFLVETVYP